MIKRRYFNAIISTFISLLIVLFSFLNSYFPPFYFLLIITIIYLANKPKFIFSIKNIVTFYYFLWFTLPVMFATRYEEYTFNKEEMVLAYIYLSITYIVIFFTVSFFESRHSQEITFENISLSRLKKLMNFFMFLSILFFIFYIQTSGGVSYWLQNLDRAFLTREGSGIYYLPFVFFLTLYSFLFGIYVKIRDKQWHLLFLFILLLLLSPFLGSKSKVLMILFLAFLPFLLFKKVKFLNTLGLIVGFLFFFVLGNYFRNTSWMTFGDLLPYMLNYFDTYHALVIGIRDIQPGLMQTTFLPFNKFSSIIGFSGQYYDMSAWLTSIYYPEADKIRATVQWPIEMDLYLNYYFFLGLPIIMMIFIWVTIIFNKSLQFNIGYVFIYGYIFFYTLSHLRGGILLWTDFYIFPYLIFSYFTLKFIENKNKKIKLYFK